MSEINSLSLVYGAGRGGKRAHALPRQPVRAADDERECVSALVSLPRRYGYAWLGAALEYDVKKPYVSAAACESRRQSFFNYLTVDLAILQGLSQELAKLFGLTLPVS